MSGQEVKGGQAGTGAASLAWWTDTVQKWNHFFQVPI